MAGHQVFGPDSIGDLSIVNSTTVEVAASTVTLGGLQYDTTALQVLTAASGAGGLDTGSVAANTKYYVYFILNAGNPALIMSVSDSAPSGFSVHKRVGFFWTDFATAVDSINEASKKRYFQSKKLTARWSSAGQIPDWTFNNVQPGKYRVWFNGYVYTTSSDDYNWSLVNTDGNYVNPDRPQAGGHGTSTSTIIENMITSGYYIFEVTTPGSVYAEGTAGSSSTGYVESGSIMFLEKLEDYEETNQWT